MDPASRTHSFGCRELQFERTRLGEEQTPPSTCAREGVREMEDLVVVFRRLSFHQGCNSCNREDLVNMVLEGEVAIRPDRTKRLRERQCLCNEERKNRTWNFTDYQSSPLTAGVVKVWESMGECYCPLICFQSKRRNLKRKSELLAESSIPSRQRQKNSHRHEDHAGRPFECDDPVTAPADQKPTRENFEIT